MKLPDSFTNKKILIVGMGVEGISTYRFLRKHFPEKKIGFSDQKDQKNLSPDLIKIIKTDNNLDCFFGSRYLSVLESYDVVFKSPGINAEEPLLKKAKEKGILITSQTELFLHQYRDRIIGITGTKGKSTTTSLIYHILKKSGKKVLLMGNIGVPPFSILIADLTDYWFVYEFSSHQLQNLTLSPHIAVVLDIVPEHLDYYKNFDLYVKAKAKIAAYQKPTDYVILNPNNRLPFQIASQSAAQQVFYSIMKQDRSVCYIENNEVIIKKESSISTIPLSDIPLKGVFNYENCMAALTVGVALDIDLPVLQLAIKSFKPLTYRLERIGNFGGITFYDDSLATIPQATIGAIEALGSDLETLITGGYDRGQVYDQLAEKIIHSSIKTLILFPTTGQRIWDALLDLKERKKIKLPEYFFVSSMKEAVEIAYQKTHKGKLCLLSNASASFNLFKDYKDKSEQFRHYIKTARK